MDFKFRWQSLACASILSLTLAACGGGDDKKQPEVKPTPTVTNVAPNITSQAPTSATEDLEYGYTLVVDDPDDDQSGLTFSLMNAPEGMMISDAGVITWTPVEGVLTSGNTLVKVADGGEDGAQPATQEFTINVIPVNDAPSITNELSQVATEDITYQQQVDIADVDDQNNGTDITFTLVDAADGMSVSNTGLITWTPAEGILTSGIMTIEVRDGGEDAAAAATQSLEIIVTPVNDAPTVAAVDGQTVESGSEWTYQLLVTDVDDTNVAEDISFNITTGPSGLMVTDTGLLSFVSQSESSTTHSVSISVSDGGEDGTQPAVVSFDIEEQVFVSISGETRNYFSGENITESRLLAANGEAVIAEASANDSGVFTLKIQDIHFNDTSRLTLSATKMGFAEAALTIAPQEYGNIHTLLMQPVHQSQIFDPAEDTELMVDDLSIVSLPGSSFVDGNGDPVSTPVQAQITIINPELDIDLMPGEMVTMGESGSLEPIESFGAITVTFSDEQGNPVEFNGSEPATVRIPATGNAILRPDTIPLYYYDSVTGIWIEEGQATLTGNAGSQYYQGEVTHFTTWNADIVYQTIYVHGCVVDSQGERVSGARISSQGRTYLGWSGTYTDDEGNFSLPVRIDANVLISATSGSESRTLIEETARTDIDMAQCIQLSEALTKMTLTWGENPTDLDSHLLIHYGDEQLAHVYYNSPNVVINDTVIHLDVDDVTSYGPEVISIPQFPVAGRYEYVIHNYSEDADMDFATTRTEIIFNNELTIMQPPVNDTALYWHVVNFNVDEDLNATVEVVNEWSDVLNNNDTPRTHIPAIPMNKFESILKGLISSKYYSK